MAVRDLGTDCVRAFLGHLEQQRGCSPQTRNQRLAAVRSFARYVCGRSAGHWIRRYQRELGYVPVFVDGTGIEVAGRCFEQAGKGYNGERQDWLHSVFVGVLWVSARLQPGGSDVGGGWREQLEQDVEPLLRNGEQVWLRADHADYRGELVAFCAARGWDYSISLTDGRKQGPLRRILADCAYADQDWTALDAEGEEAALLLYYQPAGWARAEVYVVVRRTHEDGQPLLVPHYSFILVSRDDLPAGRVGAAAPGQTGSGERLQGTAAGVEPAPPAVQVVRGQPGRLPVRAVGAIAAAGAANPDAAGGRPRARPGAVDPAGGAQRGAADAERAQAAAAVRPQQSAAGLAGRGVAVLGTARLTAELDG